MFQATILLCLAVHPILSSYLHEDTHVAELLVAHAALEAQHLRVGVRLVDVDLDLLLLPVGNQKRQNVQSDSDSEQCVLLG